MYRQLALLSLSATLLFSCSGGSNKEEKSMPPVISEVKDSSVKSPSAEPPTAPLKSFTTKGGKVIDIIETHPSGMSLSDITITGHGFSDSTITIKDENPVTDVLEADLNKDGFSEYYIITTAAGSGSYGNVLGFASEKDSALVRIKVADFKDPGDYMGHDSFRIDGVKFIRSYPAYKNKNKNAAPTGGTNTINYKLSKTAPGIYSLEPIK